MTVAKGFDYIIVGAGSAGCVLASRLTEDPSTTVLLIEDGRKNDTFLVSAPGANGFVFGHPRYDWKYRTVPQQFLDGRTVYWPRGRGLGGTSLINGMIYIRGNRRDYDGWANDGIRGWSFDDVLPYFKKSEGSYRGDNHYHSSSGPLRTTSAGNLGPLDTMFLEATAELGFRANEDFNADSQSGFGVFDVNVHHGRRIDTAFAFLRPALQRPNLSVLTNHRVLRVTFDGRRACGVEVGTIGGAKTTIQCEREIVLSAGAIATPQLLMLSGVGCGDQLRALRIPVVLEHRGVGQNLQDHLQIPVQFSCTAPHLTFDRYQRLDRALWAGLRYLANRTGPAAAPFWSSGGFVSLRGDDHPQLQLFFTPMRVTEDPVGQKKVAIPGFQIDVSLMRPQTSGQISLTTADPRDQPIIDPRYLSEPADRDDLISGVRLALDIANTKPIRSIKGDAFTPQIRSDDDVLNFIKRNSISGYHPVGTCRMGSTNDAEAVVDSHLRLKGLERLRIADASVLPRIVTGNTNAPVIMVAEKAADLIRRSP